MLVAKLGIYCFIAGSIASLLLFYINKHFVFSFFISCLMDGPIDLSVNYLKYAKAYLVRNGMLSEQDSARWVFFAQASVLSLIFSAWFGRLEVWLIKKKFRFDTADQAKAFILNELVPNGLMTKELLASIRDPKHLYMFSMSDRKVYVGRVSSIGEPHETGVGEEDFSIVPTMSGFRDKDTLKVTYTTDYSAIVEEMASNGRDVSFTILLSQENIVSISRFEDDIWNRFKEKQGKENQEQSA